MQNRDFIMKKGVVLVTGGSRGIGQKIVGRFQGEGHAVVSPSRDELDLSNKESVEAYIENYRGDLSVLVNNAGLNVLGAVAEYSDSDLEKMMETNLLSAFRLCQFAASFDSLHAICNIASVWSLQSYAGRGVYSMTKSGLVGLTRGLAHDLGPRGVVVNAVSPGFIETEMTAKNISEERRQALYNSIPLGKFGTTESVANIVEFLCSSKNEYITGQNIIIDGGFLA